MTFFWFCGMMDRNRLCPGLRPGLCRKKENMSRKAHDREMDKLDRLKGNSYAAAGAIGWGISGVCSQYLFLEYRLDSGWLTAVRMILSGILLLGLAFSREGGRIFGVIKDKKDRLWLLAFAIIGLLYCQYSFLAAIAASNSGTATILQSLNVVMMAVVMAVWNRTGISGRQAGAMVLAVAGTYLVATHGNPAAMMISPAGLAWGLSAAVGVVTYTLLSRPIVGRRGNLAVTGWGMLIGGAVLGAGLQVWRMPENIDLLGAVMIAVIVIVGTAAGFSLFLQGIRYIGPVKATLIGCLEPAAATLLSAVFLGTRFGLMEMIGFGAILGTVFLSMGGPGKGDGT